MLKQNYFSPAELTCKCGCGLNNFSALTLAKLNVARETAGIPFVITSACRCPAHNAKVGGKPSSAHLRGHAVDIRTQTSSHRYIIVAALLAAGFNRIGLADTFIHVDDDPSLPERVIFNY